MKIYFLSIDHERFFFYSDDAESSPGADSSSTPRGGLQGWLERLLVRFKAHWQEAESGLTSWLRRLWHWLHTWTRPDEWMLARLRSARRVELLHPLSRSGHDVRAIWQDYLAHQGRHHLLWLSVDAVIAPFSVLFAILPGPNVIGYWFAYRAIHHLLVVWGIRLVRRGVIPTELSAVAALDLPIERDGDGKARHAAFDGRTALLERHVAWLITARGRQASVAKEAQPGETRSERTQDE